jgi:type IV pilus biogenesis protein CpaD/CtpE
MKTITFALTAASLLFFAACTPQEPLSSDFGNAVQQNMAVQIINPGPNEKPLTYDGARTTAAVEKYRQGDVEKPEIQTTSTSN